jgi:hypothetical protein
MTKRIVLGGLVTAFFLACGAVPEQQFCSYVSTADSAAPQEVSGFPSFTDDPLWTSQPLTVAAKAKVFSFFVQGSPEVPTCHPVTLKRLKMEVDSDWTINVFYLYEGDVLIAQGQLHTGSILVELNYTIPNGAWKRFDLYLDTSEGLVHQSLTPRLMQEWWVVEGETTEYSTVTRIEGQTQARLP